MNKNLNTFLHSPYLAAPLFFGGAIYSMKVASRFHSCSQYYRIEELHILAFPFVYWNKHVCTYFWKSPQQRGQTNQENAKQILYGSLLGFGTAGIGIWIAHQKKWIVFTNPAWNTYSTKDICLSLYLIGTGMAATAYNEETVFRGYGYDLGESIVGSKVATTLLTILFIHLHGKRLLLVRKLAYGVLGINLLLLRKIGNNTTLPISYHWAWNVVLQGVWGTAKSEISIKPYYINKDTPWMGSSPQENEAKPGWLMVVLQGILAIILWVLFNKKKDQHNNS